MDNIEIRNISQKWFSDATPKNYKDASTTIGSGDDGVITITSLDDITTDKSIEVVVATEVSEEMSVSYATDKITVTLGTDSEGVADDTVNTATLIAAEINKLSGFTASVSGSGETAISEAVEEKSFTAGQLGTPSPVSGVALVSSGTYYVCIAPDTTTKNTNWRQMTFSSY